MTGKEFIVWMTDRGWVFEREGKGSHLIYRFPANNAMYVMLGNHFSDSGRKMMNMKSKIKRLENQASVTEINCCRTETRVS